ncbi:Retron-type RNA-directed DNA polymerase [Microcystis panniformis FACHB-1757]|jgi:hypothetical protein|uniref:Retron-type RNA-directed DNA polymerase n=1 Tax=Microcystis panniformis FACHB-1757 TaxID=1638788 RepID=A0A0K1S2U4_9CHRO|nr:Retron-type RNA-directed DNA polymerase [Microcystis panniformis FACHB-1757]
MRPDYQQRSLGKRKKELAARGLTREPVVENQVKNRLFGLCYATDGGYKGWNPYIERHLAIFVNCFCSRAN